MQILGGINGNLWVVQLVLQRAKGKCCGVIYLYTVDFCTVQVSIHLVVSYSARDGEITTPQNIPLLGTCFDFGVNANLNGNGLYYIGRGKNPHP